MYVFLDGYKYDFSAEQGYHFAYTADSIWVACLNRTVKIARFWGEDSTQIDTIDLTSYFTNPCVYVVKGGNYVYAFEGTAQSAPYTGYFLTSFVAIDRTTKQVVWQKQLPRNVHCIPAYAKFKLWFITPAFQSAAVNDRQSLFYYDTQNDSWSSTTIVPGNKQFTPRQIVWGKSDFLLVDSFNENGYLKFDTSGTYQSMVLVNRKPLSIFVSDDKKVFVSGKNGRINRMDLNSDVNDANFSTVDEAVSIAIVDGYIWSANPKLTRTEMATTTDNIRTMDGQTKDYSIQAFSTTTFKQVAVMQPYVHQRWNPDTSSIENVTEPKKIIVLAENGKLFVAYNLTDSWDLPEIRQYELSVKATAIVATGPESYYGETE